MHGTTTLSLTNLAQRKIAQPSKVYCPIFSSFVSNKGLFPVNTPQFQNTAPLFLLYSASSCVCHSVVLSSSVRNASQELSDLKASPVVPFSSCDHPSHFSRLFFIFCPPHEFNVQQVSTTQCARHHAENWRYEVDKRATDPTRTERTLPKGTKKISDRRNTGATRSETRTLGPIFGYQGKFWRPNDKFSLARKREGMRCGFWRKCE